MTIDGPQEFQIGKNRDKETRQTEKEVERRHHILHLVTTWIRQAQDRAHGEHTKRLYPAMDEQGVSKARHVLKKCHRGSKYIGVRQSYSFTFQETSFNCSR